MVALILIGDPWQALKYIMIEFSSILHILYFFSKKNVYYELKIVYLLQLHKNALPQYELLYCMYIKVEKGG